MPSLVLGLARQFFGACVVFLRTGDTEASVLDGTLGFASSYIEQPRALARKGGPAPYPGSPDGKGEVVS